MKRSFPPRTCKIQFDDLAARAIEQTIDEQLCMLSAILHRQKAQLNIGKNENSGRESTGIHAESSHSRCVEWLQRCTVVAAQLRG